jgi:phage FluMu gp28-like protein
VPYKPYFAGLDLARVEDFTVLVILNDRREIVYVDRFHRLDWSLQVGRIESALSRYNHARTFVDSTGVGSPIFEQLRKAGVEAIAYPFTQRSKSELVDNLALLLERRELKLPRAELWPEGIDELESFEYSISDAGSVKSGAPSGVHDDCVVALALAAWHHRVRFEPISIPSGPILICGDRPDIF